MLILKRNESLRVLNRLSALLLISSQAQATTSKIKNIALKRATTGNTEFRLREDNDTILNELCKRLDNQAELDKWSMRTLSIIFDIIGELRNALDFSLTELKGPGKQKRSSTAANLEPGSPEPPKKLPKEEDTKSTTKHGAVGGTTIKAKKPLSLMISTDGSPSMKCFESLTDTPSRSLSREDSWSSLDESFLLQVTNDALNGGEASGSTTHAERPSRDDWTPMNGGIWSPEI